MAPVTSRAHQKLTFKSLATAFGWSLLQSENEELRVLMGFSNLFSTLLPDLENLKQDTLFLLSLFDCEAFGRSAAPQWRCGASREDSNCQERCAGNTLEERASGDNDARPRSKTSVSKAERGDDCMANILLWDGER